jgi:hypothetical protein
VRKVARRLPGTKRVSVSSIMSLVGKQVRSMDGTLTINDLLDEVVLDVGV